MAFLEEYTLLDELGQGGYATVYKVRHNNLGYIRAIRVLNAIIAHGETDKTYQKFLEECRLLLRLGNGNHPNIVHIYQPLLKAQRAIVEMDFVDGKDLYHYLEEKHSFVEIKDVLRLLNDIGSALAYCHEDIYRFCMDKDEDGLKDDPEDGRKVLLDNKTKQRLINKYRVIHNDIHSGNIIRREDGSYVLLDFGLAIEGDSVVRSSRRKNGAPEFKAPEKWDNDSILTTQSDIYSFGVVLYEYLAGRVPFLFDKKNSNPVEAEYLLGKAHKEQQPASVFDLRKTAFENSHPGEIYEKDYPDWLEALIMKCLSKSTKDRFKNGKELYSFVLEHIGSEADVQIEKLNKEITALKNELSSVENSANTNKEALDKYVTDLQTQLNDTLLSKKVLDKKVKTLQSENAALKARPENENNDDEEKEAQKNRIESLLDDLKNADEKNEALQARVRKLTTEKNTLQNKNTELNEKISQSISKVWKVLSILFFIVAGVAVLLYWTKPTTVSTIAVPAGDHNIYMTTDGLEIKTANEIIAERDSLLEVVDNMVNDDNSSYTDGGNAEVDNLRKEISEKDAQISTLSAKVDELNQKVQNTKGNNAGGYSQSDINARDKTIKQLNATLRNLRDEIKKKDRLISVLNDQIGVN